MEKARAQGVGTSDDEGKKKNGWTQIRALAVSNINIDTVSKPVYYQV